MSYFDKTESLKTFIKILSGVIVALILLNLLIFKSLISVIENKTIQIQVPQFMEAGNYVIGDSFASEKVYKMWVSIWIKNMTSFSYKNIRQKYNTIYPFLDSQTAFKSKSEIMRFADFVEKNFITQRFNLNDIKVRRASNGMTKVTAYGKVYRRIGKKKDELDGLQYSYTFTVYTRHGQIYIYSIKSSFYRVRNSKNKDKLKSNTYVNFDEAFQ